MSELTLQKFSALVSSERNRKKYCLLPITHSKTVYKYYAFILNLQFTPNVVTEYTVREKKLFLTSIIATQRW